jgi:hypothetical protein
MLYFIFLYVIITRNTVKFLGSLDTRGNILDHLYSSLSCRKIIASPSKLNLSLYHLYCYKSMDIQVLYVLPLNALGLSLYISLGYKIFYLQRQY